MLSRETLSDNCLSSDMSHGSDDWPLIRFLIEFKCIDVNTVKLFNTPIVSYNIQTKAIYRFL